LSRLRIATVPYVNAAPLVWGFTHGTLGGEVDLTAAPPSLIPDLLREGQVDAGLIPVIETQRVDGLVIHPSLCIASPLRARSVLLLSRRPLAGIRRVALDTSSRSSAALLRILLAGRGLGGLTFVEQKPSLPEMLETADAALLIGDPALAADTAGLEVMDLAEEWHAATGLPFVFAVWAIRRGAAVPGAVDLFEASYREGIGRIDEVARRVAPRSGLPVALVAGYLRDNIRYRLGPPEARAIQLFFARARDLGLIGAPRPLDFAPVSGGSATRAQAAAGAAREPTEGPPAGRTTS
jgi:chorismate dehydratase